MKNVAEINIFKVRLSYKISKQFDLETVNAKIF